MTAIYIAGAGSEIDRALKAIRAARAAGFTVTSTWPDSILRVGSANPADASVAERSVWSEKCLEEVHEADVVWFLVPPLARVTRGAWVETGYAHAFRRHLVFSGENTHQSIFCALGEEFADDDSALVHLKAWAADVRLRRGMRELAEWPGPQEIGE